MSKLPIFQGFSRSLSLTRELQAETQVIFSPKSETEFFPLNCSPAQRARLPVRLGCHPRRLVLGLLQLLPCLGLDLRQVRREGLGVGQGLGRRLLRPVQKGPVAVLRLQREQGCQMAKSDPFLSLDCARVEGVGAHSKERKGSNFAAQRSGAIVLKLEGPNTYELKIRL